MEKKWRKIDKPLVEKVREGTYSDWKPELAKEAQERCVYCAINHQELGGIRNFHVEHFKPKSNPRFETLENDYNNLFYACPICNTFKSKSWFDAEEGDWNTIHYPYPAQYNYGDLFEFSEDIYTLLGGSVVGRFLIERFHLNRFHLIRYRRFDNNKDKSNNILKTMTSILTGLESLIDKNIEGALSLYKEIAHELLKFTQIQQGKFDLPLYAPDELRQDNKY